MGCVVARAVYIGAKKGWGVEIFKLLGMVFATFITMHYYVRFGKFLHDFVLVPQSMQEFIGFIVLWFGVVIMFKVIRDGWLLVVKGKSSSPLPKIIGAVFGAARGILICGLIFVLIFLSRNTYLFESARKSFSGFHMSNFSSNLYDVAYESVVKKIFSAEKKNEKVFQLKKKPSGQ